MTVRKDGTIIDQAIDTINEILKKQKYYFNSAVFDSKKYSGICIEIKKIHV